MITRCDRATVTRKFYHANLLEYESTPFGEIQYIYDAENRCQTMMMPRQSDIMHRYEAASRLSDITQGWQAIVFGYTNAKSYVTAGLAAAGGRLPAAVPIAAAIWRRRINC